MACYRENLYLLTIPFVLGRQLQAASLGLPLMAARSRIISGKVIVTEIVKKSPTIWNPKKLPCLQEPLLYPVLIQMNSFHILTAHFSQILFNIMLPSAPKYSREHISVGYLAKCFPNFSSLLCYNSAFLVSLI